MPQVSACLCSLERPERSSSKPCKTSKCAPIRPCTLAPLSTLRQPPPSKSQIFWANKANERRKRDPFSPPLHFYFTSPSIARKTPHFSTSFWGEQRKPQHLDQPISLSSLFLSCTTCISDRSNLGNAFTFLLLFFIIVVASILPFFILLSSLHL